MAQMGLGGGECSAETFPLNLGSLSIWVTLSKSTQLGPHSMPAPSVGPNRRGGAATKLGHAFSSLWLSCHSVSPIKKTIGTGKQAATFCAVSSVE
jgi:hypothetical protein